MCAGSWVSIGGSRRAFRIGSCDIQFFAKPADFHNICDAGFRFDRGVSQLQYGTRALYLPEFVTDSVATRRFPLAFIN